MKKSLLSLGFMLISMMFIYAQVPQSFKYQAIVRSESGEIIANKDISIKIGLLMGEKGDAVYSEIHEVKTNEYGLINLKIGTGTVEKGSFSSIQWDLANFYIHLAIDMDGGRNFREMGTAEILSVPYALFAGNVSNNGSSRGSTEWDNNGSDVFVSPAFFPSANVGVGVTTPAAKLHVYGPGFTGPNRPMLFIQHQNGFSSTFQRSVEGPANALFLLQKSRGNSDVPAAVQDGDNVGQIRMEAFDGADYKTAGWIRVAVDGPVSSGIVPGALLFATTDNAGSVTERMRISSDGNIGIGTVAPGSLLHIDGVVMAQGGDSDDWNSAYGWGDHSTAGYLTSYTETDPVFNASLASAITMADTTNWFTAFGWGDHASVGYLTGESDPIYLASIAGAIDGVDTANWNAAFNWGDHALVGYQNVNDTNLWDATKYWVNQQAYLTSETDPEVGANSLNYLPKWDGSALVSSNVYDDGNIGIGISAPGSKLDVDGALNIASDSAYKIGGNEILHNRGVESLFAGMYAGSEITSGGKNTAFGFMALSSTTTGYNNIAFGNRALENNITGYSNLAIGLKALHLNDTGSNNIAIGNNALLSNSEGSSNIAIGLNALNLNDTGAQNIAIGNYALAFNQGFNNVAVGVNAMQLNDTGSFNTAIGAAALLSNNGYFNTAVGAGSLALVDTGSNNTAIGSNALVLNKASGNTAVGANSLLRDSTGSYNTGVGLNVLSQNTTGSYNAAFGAFALFNDTIGEGNTAIGYEALFYDSTGNYNTALGYKAGYHVLEGDSSVYLGNEAGYYSLESNRLFIANSKGDSLTHKSDALIYGEFDNAKLAVNGMLGVGTVSPSEKLEVTGNIKGDTIKAVSVGTQGSGTAIFSAGRYVSVLNTSSLAGSDPLSISQDISFIVHNKGSNDSLQLPDPSGVNSGKIFDVKNLTTSNLYITNAGGNVMLADTATSSTSVVTRITMSQGNSRKFVSNGTYWFELY